MFAIHLALDKWHLVRRSTLLMNSIYLMFATGAVAAFGFIFWTVVAHKYSTNTVGLATTLLSLSGLISLLSIAGFDTTLVRFLPKSERRNDQINSGLIIVALLGIVLSLGFAFALPITSPHLAFVLHSPWYLASFVFFTVATSLNTLTNAVFLALKRVIYILLINVAFSALKVALPLLAPSGDAMAIFNFAGLAQLFGLALSLGVMWKQLGYSFAPKVHWDILHIIKRYSLAFFTSSIINLLPATLLPLLVTKQLGPENAAYFYMAFTISNLLYVIAYASMQSAFAEGSHDESSIRQHITKAAKLVAILLIPSTVFTVWLSPIILSVFGRNYAAHGQTLLQLFAISAILVAIYAAMGATFKVTKNLRGVIIMNTVYAITVLGLSYLLAPHFGLTAIGWAWLAGNLLASTVALIFIRRSSYARASPIEQ